MAKEQIKQASLQLDSINNRLNDMRADSVELKNWLDYAAKEDSTYKAYERSFLSGKCFDYYYFYNNPQLRSLERLMRDDKVECIEEGSVIKFVRK